MRTECGQNQPGSITWVKLVIALQEKPKSWWTPIWLVDKPSAVHVLVNAVFMSTVCLWNSFLELWFAHRHGICGLLPVTFDICHAPLPQPAYPMRLKAQLQSWAMSGWSRACLHVNWGLLSVWRWLCGLCHCVGCVVESHWRHWWCWGCAVLVVMFVDFRFVFRWSVNFWLRMGVNGSLMDWLGLHGCHLHWL